MASEKGMGERAARLARVSVKAAKIAKAASVGGPKAAAAETARQFWPQLLKFIALILVVFILLPFLIFASIPHFLFDWLGSIFDDILNMNWLANIVKGIYSFFSSLVKEETDKYEEQLLADYDTDGDHEITVNKDVGNTDVLWFIAIMGAYQAQDLEVINETSIRQLIADMLRGTVTVSYGEGDNISSVKVDIRDLTPVELMETLGFTEEQRNWAELMYTVMTGDEISEFDFLNEYIYGGDYSFEYGDPGTPMGDGSYEALIAEAEKHLGKQYQFGGSGPDVFDCSGYVSYVLHHSGAANFGRQTAQGLFNRCTPIQPSDAMPGDLVFFHSTWDAGRPVTHVGIFVGEVDGRSTMIHAGKPIQYAPIDTVYWRSKFYAYGRLPG